MEVSGDKYCTSSKEIPLIHCILLKVKPVKLENSVTQELQSLIIKVINMRMDVIIERVITVAIAIILYPRFKKMRFMNPIACLSTVVKVKEMMKTRVQSEAVESDSSDLSDKREDNFSLREDHHKKRAGKWGSPTMLFVTSYLFTCVAQ